MVLDHGLLGISNNPSSFFSVIGDQNMFHCQEVRDVNLDLATCPRSCRDICKFRLRVGRKYPIYMGSHMDCVLLVTEEPKMESRTMGLTGDLYVKHNDSLKRRGYTKVAAYVGCNPNDAEYWFSQR